MASTIDTTFSFVRETVPGVVPATPAFQTMDVNSGGDFTFGGDIVTSDLMRKNRMNAAAVLLNQSASGSLTTHARREAIIDGHIEAAIGGAFSGSTAKAGNTDFYYTVEKRMLEKGTPMFFRYSSVKVSGMTVSVEKGSNAEMTFDYVGAGRATASSIVTGATYPAQTLGTPLSAKDVGSISIGGLTAKYTSLELSVENAHEPVFVLSNPSAVDVNVTPAPRMIKTTLKALRQSLAVDALAGTTVDVIIPIGGVGTGYSFAFKGVVSVPQDEVDGSSAIVSLEITAVEDTVAGTDLTVTKL